MPQWDMTKSRRRWHDLGPGARAAVIIGAVIQFGLLGAAQVDIKRRTAEQLNGPRWLWIGVSLINFVGPVAYFLFGRRNSTATEVPAGVGH
jgi:hypothetical protein